MDIDAIDRELREAIHARDVISVRRLLAAGARLDYCVAGETPLHYCLSNYCWKVDKDVVQARNNKRGREIEIIRELITKSANDSDILDCLNNSGESPLQEAINYGDLETVEMLVRAGASLENINRTAENALHVAARAQQHHVLKYFLDNHDIPNSNNKYNYTPLHFSAISGEVESMKLLLEKFGHEQLIRRNNEGCTVWHEVAGWHSIEIAQYLLKGDCKYRSDLNLVDNQGSTPVLSAAAQGDAAMTAILLRNGAALAAKRATESTIKAISKQFTNPSTFLEEIFDDCVCETEKCVNVDFKVLTDSDGTDGGMSQIKVMEELVRWGQSSLLKHPMIESLIYLKWKCLLPVFYVIVAIYATFLGSFTLFVVRTFNEIDTQNRTQNSSVPSVEIDTQNRTQNGSVPSVEIDTQNITENGSMLININLRVSLLSVLGEEIDNQNITQNGSMPTNGGCVAGCGRSYWTLVVLIYLSIGVLLFQECIWIRLRKLRYLAHREPWVKLFGLSLAALVPLLVGGGGAAPAPWERVVACAALLLAWLQAMLLLSRFPGWGYYVLMFERVAINVMKVLLTSICLVVGFSVCFMILYQSKPPFDGFIAAFVKTLVMMLSEFDYEDLFSDEHAELEDTKPIVRLLFVAFVIFVAIVMMNFMIGVAVSDINDLNAIGNVRRLEKQVELLSTLEGLGDTVLANWWKRLSRIRFHSDMGRSLSDQGRRWIVYPNQYNRDYDYFRQTFNPELHNAICNLARKKKQSVNKLDALYDAVVGPPKLKRQDSRIGEQDPYVSFKDRIKSVEDINQEIKQSIEVLNKNDSRFSKSISNSIKELRDCVYVLRKDMNTMLIIAARSVRRSRPGYTVSRKMLSRQLELMAKRRKR